MKRTGLFSGSFNPVHIGHLALANWICEYEELDEVWFMVTPRNPLKEQETLMEDALRYKLVETAIRGYRKFRASDFEFSLPRPSYTIDTLRALDRAFPHRSFHFIMGADNWTNITRWKEWDTLIRRYPILIYPRPGHEVVVPPEWGHIKKVDAPRLEVSSSFIRQAYEEGKDVRFFLPETIRPYFEQKEPV